MKRHQFIGLTDKLQNGGNTAKQSATALQSRPCLPKWDVMTVEIYTQPWCPYCERALALLDQKGVAYKEISAAQGTPARREAMQRSGSSTVPQIFIGDRHVGGCDDLVALDRSGRLDGMLTAA